MGEVVALKTATAPAGTFTTLEVFPAVGSLRIILGRMDWPDCPSEWAIVIRAPGAPDMGIAKGSLPEGGADDDACMVAGHYIDLAKAALEVARIRIPALTANAPPTEPKGAA